MAIQPSDRFVALPTQSVLSIDSYTQTQDISRTRGDTYADEFSVVNTKTYLPADITGCTFKMTLDTQETPVDSSTNVYEVDGVLEDAPNGLVVFSPSATQVNVVGIFYYDIEMTDASGIVRTVASGIYQYLQDITK